MPELEDQHSSYLSFAQSFTTRALPYDNIYRLASASDTGGWSRKFSYDSYGNMWVSGSSGVSLAGNTPTSNVYSAANRISGSSYDASGNARPAYSRNAHCTELD